MCSPHRLDLIPDSLNVDKILSQGRLCSCSEAFNHITQSSLAASSGLLWKYCIFSLHIEFFSLVNCLCLFVQVSGWKPVQQCAKGAVYVQIPAAGVSVCLCSSSLSHCADQYTQPLFF